MAVKIKNNANHITDQILHNNIRMILHNKIPINTQILVEVFSMDTFDAVSRSIVDQIFMIILVN